MEKWIKSGMYLKNLAIPDKLIENINCAIYVFWDTELAS